MGVLVAWSQRFSIPLSTGTRQKLGTRGEAIRSSPPWTMDSRAPFPLPTATLKPAPTTVKRSGEVASSTGGIEATSTAGGGGASTGTGSCSQATTWPLGAHGASSARAKLTLSRYSRPGSGDGGVNGTTSSRSPRAGRSRGGSVPPWITSPSAVSSHRTSA